VLHGFLPSILEGMIVTLTVAIASLLIALAHVGDLDDFADDVAMFAGVKCIVSAMSTWTERVTLVAWPGWPMAESSCPPPSAWLPPAVAAAANKATPSVSNVLRFFMKIPQCG